MFKRYISLAIFTIRKSIFLILFLAMLALNLAILTVSSVNSAVSGILATATGVQTVYSTLKSSETRLKKELTLTQRSLRKLKTKLPRKIMFKGRKMAVREAVTYTRKRVRNRIARAATRNVSSLVGEAIPFLGVGITIGVVALDMRDYCKNMKDMDELATAVAPANLVDPTTEKVCGLEIPTKEEVWQQVKSSPGKAWDAAKSHLPDLPEWSPPRWWSIIMNRF